MKVDMPKLMQPLQQVNTHKVNARKWKNWPDICQRVFNHTYELMRDNQRIYIHPKSAIIPDKQWSTTAWNAAWEAADMCQRALKDIIKQRGYARELIP